MSVCIYAFQIGVSCSVNTVTLWGVAVDRTACAETAMWEVAGHVITADDPD